MLDDFARQSSSAGESSGVPIASLYHITRLHSLRSKQLPVPSNRINSHTVRPKDLISRGLLDWADADRLVKAYLGQTDYYLYGITSHLNDIDSIRGESTLLFTAICAVAALHNAAGQTIYRICSAELRRLVSNLVFTSQVNLDDFRGMCIACFWLSDISWQVSGLAIRRAFEFQLHKSYNLVVDSSTIDASSLSSIQLADRSRAIDCMRVWYLFYICDQHLSILYGRPSTIGEQESITNWEKYLAAIPTSIMDQRLASQVALLLILDQVLKLFGTNVDLRIPTLFKAQLDNFNHQLDQWVTTWLGRYGEFHDTSCFLLP
jgi:hypothetical protein